MYLCVSRQGTVTTSLNALVPASQRVATLRLSAPTENVPNHYDVLRGDDPTYDVRRPSYDYPTSACRDDGYLTPVQPCYDRWTTATTYGYERVTDSAGYDGLTDSGKYLQLQNSVYYEYI